MFITITIVKLCGYGDGVFTKLCGYGDGVFTIFVAFAPPPRMSRMWCWSALFLFITYLPHFHSRGYFVFFASLFIFSLIEKYIYRKSSCKRPWALKMKLGPKWGGGRLPEDPCVKIWVKMAYFLPSYGCFSEAMYFYIDAWLCAEDQFLKINPQIGRFLSPV
jgi:hypothetical protein